MELGKPNTLPDQSAAPGTERKMIALNALCIPFPGYDSTLCDVFLICVIVIRINPNQYEKVPARLAVRPGVCVLAYQSNRPAERRYDDLLPTTANTVVICHGQRTTSHPFPPHPDQFVQKILCQPLLLDVPGYIFDLPAMPSFPFFKMAVTESFAIPNIRPVARVPVQSMANLRTCSLTFGSHALLVYSSTKLR